MKWRYAFYFPFALGLVVVPELLVIRRLLERGECIRSNHKDLFLTYGGCLIGLVVWLIIFREEQNRREWAIFLIVISTFVMFAYP